MSFLPRMVPRYSHAPMGCGCGMGCSSNPGCGCGMGDDDALDPSKVKQLQVEINRFAGPSVAKAMRIRDTKLAVTGVLDLGTALFAVTLLQRRATSALEQGRGGQADLTALIAAMQNPVSYVSSNLDGVVQAIGLYADSLGLSGGDMPFDAKRALTDPKTMAIVGGLALGVFLFTRRRGR